MVDLTKNLAELATCTHLFKSNTLTNQVGTGGIVSVHKSVLFPKPSSFSTHGEEEREPLGKHARLAREYQNTIIENRVSAVWEENSPLP